MIAQKYMILHREDAYFMTGNVPRSIVSSCSRYLTRLYGGFFMGKILLFFIAPDVSQVGNKARMAAVFE